MVIVTGPRIDPASLPCPDGVEIRGYIPDLHRHFAACDIALVQGGLTTCMELAAARVPFLYFPLRHHFEQNFHVAPPAAALRRRPAPWTYDSTSPERDRRRHRGSNSAGPSPYRPVASDGAARAARRRRRSSSKRHRSTSGVLAYGISSKRSIARQVHPAPSSRRQHWRMQCFDLQIIRRPKRATIRETGAHGRARNGHTGRVPRGARQDRMDHGPAAIPRPTTTMNLRQFAARGGDGLGRQLKITMAHQRHADQTRRDQACRAVGARSRPARSASA